VISGHWSVPFPFERLATDYRSPATAYEES
jgi:hypothetical protein